MRLHIQHIGVCVRALKLQQLGGATTQGTQLRLGQPLYTLRQQEVSKQRMKHKDLRTAGSKAREVLFGRECFQKRQRLRESRQRGGAALGHPRQYSQLKQQFLLKNGPVTVRLDGEVVEQ